MDAKDLLILQLAERVYRQSMVLVAAAERLNWDTEKVQTLITALDNQVQKGLMVYGRCIESQVLESENRPIHIYRGAPLNISVFQRQMEAD